MAILDYQGRSSAQRFTEERFGTVQISGDALYRTVTGQTVGPVRNRRTARTGRLTGQVQLDGRWHPFCAADDASPIFISPNGKAL